MPEHTYLESPPELREVLAAACQVHVESKWSPGGGEARILFDQVRQQVAVQHGPADANKDRVQELSAGDGAHLLVAVEELQSVCKQLRGAHLWYEDWARLGSRQWCLKVSAIRTTFPSKNSRK